MPRFGVPDAEWAEQFDWTRYRGSRVYPVPADWVLASVGDDGIRWSRFPGIGEGLETSEDIAVVFENDTDAIAEARAEGALLGLEVGSSGDGGRQELACELLIAEEAAFRRIAFDREELFGCVADVLARYSGGQDVDEIAVEPATGRPLEDDP